MKYYIRTELDRYNEREYEAKTKDEAINQAVSDMLEFLTEEADAEDITVEVFDTERGEWA